MFNNSKFWASHRIILPEARQIAINQCCGCLFFVTIQGARETRQGCVAGVRKYQSLAVRVPPVIHVMELLKSEGRNGLAKILERGNPLAQACGLWMARQKKK